MSKSSLSLLALAGVEPYRLQDGEEYMNEKQVQHFKKILQAWKDQIHEETSRTVAHMQDEASNFRIRQIVRPKKKSSAWNYAIVIVNAN